MSYRRKAPVSKTLPVAEKLGKLCNAAAGPLPFQVQNSVALLEQMKQHQRQLFDAFSARAAVQQFFPARIVTEGLRASPHVYTLPIAKHFIHPEDSESDFEPRTFYHVSSIENPDKLLSRQSKHIPRCGLSGLFFAREEVVDNLQAAARDLNFKSPFWIHKNHPGLQSGYLTVRSGSESICISLTASVISIEDIAPFDRKLLFPLLREMVSEKTGCCEPTSSVPLGMNALSGQVTANPCIQKFPSRGLWISHDQLLLHSLLLKPSKSDKKPREKLALAEIEQWDLYNADQLTVPGRLGLQKSVSNRRSSQLFQPV